MDSILTNYYHEYILERIYEIDDIAQGDRTIFLQLFDGVKITLGQIQI